MNNATSQSPPLSPPKKSLDTVVKLALMVFFGSFALIWGGMYLSRPDRSIPPYSIGSQEDTAVSVHVPAWTQPLVSPALSLEAIRYTFFRPEKPVPKVNA